MAWAYGGPYILLLAALAIASPSFAEPFQLDIERIKGPNGELIQNLELSEKLSSVVQSQAFQGADYVVNLKGHYSRKNWNLLIHKTEIRPDINSKYPNLNIRIGIRAAVSQLMLTAIGPKGEVERETIVLKTDEKLFQNRQSTSPSKHKWNLGLGITSIKYTEGASFSHSAWVATVKGGYVYQISSTIDIGASFYGTALPLITQPSDTVARFIGVNGRVGIHIPLGASTRFSLFPGVYYTTMLIARGQFGFQNLMGPQVLALLSRSVSANPWKHLVSGYVKFSTVGSGLGITSLSDRELAGGISYRRTIAGTFAYSIGLDVARLQVIIDGLQVISDSTSIGLGFHW